MFLGEAISQGSYKQEQQMSTGSTSITQKRLKSANSKVWQHFRTIDKVGDLCRMRDGG